MDITETRKQVGGFLAKAKKVSLGMSLAEAEVDTTYVRAYGEIARRCRDDKDFGVTPYPYEQGPGVGAFSGGFFEHRDWPERRFMEKHASLRGVYEYEANYTNAAGYWMAFHEAAIDLRQEKFDAGELANAVVFDVWACIAIRYGLRVVGLRTQFYRLAAKDPTYAKMIMPTLEQRNEVAPADDLTETMDKLDSHMTTQLMKAVATLSASNTTKKAGKGGAAGSN